MKRLVCFLLAVVCSAVGATLAAGASPSACALDNRLQDKTLRVDCVFSGTSTSSEVALASLACWDGWCGRRCNMKDLAVEGNGQITMTDRETGDTLYRNSFSTLFQEWQMTPEAKVCRRSFENTFLVPMPAVKAVVSVKLFNSRRICVVDQAFCIDPEEILIRRVAARAVPGVADPIDPAIEADAEYVLYSDDPSQAIDIVIVAEGYTASERTSFLAAARTAVEAILSHEPFKSQREKFNFLAVAAASEDSGVSIPRESVWKNTAAGSNFDTFHMNRYLTTGEVFRLNDLLEGLPYEHVVILANTETYGGGGIFNFYTLTTALHENFRPVVVHEFGHSFAGLGDEYDYAGEEDPYYTPDVEPWEQNITTKHDLAAKWQDMMGSDGVSLVEGAGYQSKGVWRPREDCRMRTNKCEDFCPVCVRAITRVINFYTKE